MDWIDGKIDVIRRKIHNMSLKRALGAYIVIAIIVLIPCYFAILTICNTWRTTIISKYTNTVEPVSEYNIIDIEFQYNIETIDISAFDKKILTIIEIAEPLSIFILVALAIALTSHFYYKNKLEEPIKLLKEEAKYISRDDLSYVCWYDTSDEMGDICEAFEKMRKQLICNQKNMWERMEEQRTLNAAFAHDLRTPLTVMQGYTEFLNKYYPKNKISEEKLIETLSLLNEQVIRLKKFSDTMKNIHSFDSMEIKKKRKNITLIRDKIEEITNGLKEHHKVRITIDSRLPKIEGYYDEEVILEVVENILSNAVRYTKSKIDILLEMEEEKLFIYVRDNGRGFSSEELYKATSPYYSDKENSVEHFGIGLSICKILCQKHGGNISLSNSTNGGAIVCTNFFVL
ncbi:sensor histidine kinase [Clostridium sp. Marseille-P299]|uniref:sensor histidine kinase n=1 Tax=Clostridium sp. Marseille-P299 TaxID=1805477 RepID=UPI00082A41A7|nr:sensor histidine kinase [Clostridium sp. Marseille-P299]